MTAPLNEKGLEAAHNVIWPATEWNDGEHACRETVRAAIRAYLAASPSPSEMEVVAWRYLSGAKGAKWTVQKNRPDVASWPGYTVEPLVTLSQAQSALAAMGDKLAIAERNRDAGRDNFHTMQQSAADLAAQVLRLTEENEALRKERDEARNEAWALADQVNEWGAWAEGLTPVEISNGMAKREARIKALEEALREISRDVVHTSFGAKPTRGAEIARTTLKENAL